MKERLMKLWAENQDIRIALILLFIFLSYCLVSEG